MSAMFQTYLLFMSSSTDLFVGAASGLVSDPVADVFVA